ncbi:MAG TPA: hypothetical protein DD733_03715 [Clostridiales bacterium]|nr:hypothetical protein [Clostridiales bacterium]
MRFEAKYDIIKTRKSLKNQGLVIVLLSRNQSENRVQINMVCIRVKTVSNKIKISSELLSYGADFLFPCLSCF